MGVERELVSALQAVRDAYADKPNYEFINPPTFNTLVRFTPKLVFNHREVKTLEDALYSYITEKYSNKLDEKQKRLLLPKIEAYLLNLLNPQDEIHSLLNEARDTLLHQKAERQGTIKPKLG